MLTTPDDAAASRVERKLRERGADVLRVNDNPFPARVGITLSCSSSEPLRHVLHVDGARVALDDITAAWDRFPSGAVPAPEIAESALRHYIEGEADHYRDDAWGALDCCWVPARRPVIRRANQKATQLDVARQLGLEIPPTLMTNDPEEFYEFYRRHDGQIISKPVNKRAVPLDGAARHFWVTRVEPVSRRDVGYANTIRYSPVIFQAYVPKRLELRITVVGERIFPVEIDSQRTNRTKHDWRHYDLAHTPHRPHELPDDVTRRILRLMAHFEICLCAVDMVLTPDGRYVFLEINPTPQYDWIELLTRLPISDAICDLLLTGPGVGAASEQRPAR